MRPGQTPRAEDDLKEALRASEERFESLVDFSSDWYWEQDEAYRFTVVRGSRLSSAGGVSEHFLGTARWDCGAVPVGDGGSWDKHKAVLEAHGAFSDFAYKRANSQGEVRYINASGQPVYGVDGRFRGYSGIAKDVTESRHAEALLRLEHSVANNISEAEGVTAAMTAAIHAVCESEGWECGRYFRWDEEAGLLRFAESWGVPDPAIQEFIDRSRGISYEPGIGLMGRVWQSRQPLWVADVTKDARALRAAFTADLGIRGAFVFPVMAEGKPIGALAFNSRQVRKPDEQLLNAILVIGSQMGQYLRRKQVEEELHRFRVALDDSADMILLIDRKTMRFVDVNETVCKLLGYSREELLRMGPRDLLPASEQRLDEVYDEFIANPALISGMQSSYRRKDGSTFPFESTRRVFRSGDTHIIVAISRDISERQHAEQALRQSEEKYRTILDGIEEAYYEVDLKGNLVMVNAAFRRMMGYSEGELQGMNYRQFQRPEVASSVYKVFNDVHTSGIPNKSFDWEMLCKDGGSVMGEGSVRLLADAEGRPIGFGGMLRDVTARRQMEQALRESEERFRSLTQLSSDLYWQQDDQYRFTYIKGSGSERINERSQKFIGRKRWEADYVNMAADDWAGHVASLDARQPFRDLELCWLDVSGRKIWNTVSGEPVFDPAGVFQGYRGVAKDITERKNGEERIQHLASHDALTSLPNRTMFSEMLNGALHNARRYNRSFAVLFIDLDRFKIINDTLGHEAGDQLLQEMGKRLTHTVRASDVVARLGGDEFVVLVQEVGEINQVAAVARKILSVLVKPLYIERQECRVTASIGICTYPADAQDEQSLMRNADIAMYRAKEDGKNTYKFYSEEISVHSFERMALETSLRRGLERDEFFLHYQAKLDLRTRQITGVEALVRWQHPELGMVSPAQFIPLAEETGLIVPIGKWVLRTACAQNVAWQRQGLPALCMAVNLSARQFADQDLIEDVAGALRDSEMKPELLELELTESMVMQNHERAGRVFARIKELGVRLAIDDFGVGYSSLAHLKRFPIDTLKVDQSFIRDISGDSGNKAITQAIIAMGKSLNLTVVAEGVETLEQETFLREHSCDETQGYYFSRPIPKEQFAEMLHKHVASAKP